MTLILLVPLKEYRRVGMMTVLTIIVRLTKRRRNDCWKCF